MIRLRTLLVDDEPHARRLLRALLEEHQELEIVGEAEDGSAAKAMLDAGEIDLVFLDVQMPEMSGLDLIDAVGPEAMPAIIFVTAYDRYAVRAFEVHALDYILKPYDGARLSAAVSRAVTEVRHPIEEHPGDRLISMLEQVRAHREFPQRIVVRTSDRILLVQLDEVSWIEAEDKTLRLHAGKNVFATRGSMRMLEEQLDPARFVRIQRSLMVNVAYVRELQPWFQGDHVIVLRDGTKLTSGRTYRENVLSILKAAALA